MALLSATAERSATSYSTRGRRRPPMYHRSRFRSTFTRNHTLTQSYKNTHARTLRASSGACCLSKPRRRVPTLPALQNWHTGTPLSWRLECMPTSKLWRRISQASPGVSTATIFGTELKLTRAMPTGSTSMNSSVIGTYSLSSIKHQMCQTSGRPVH